MQPKKTERKFQVCVLAVLGVSAIGLLLPMRNVSQSSQAFAASKIKGTKVHAPFEVVDGHGEPIFHVYQEQSITSGEKDPKVKTERAYAILQNRVGDGVIYLSSTGDTAQVDVKGINSHK